MALLRGIGTVGLLVSIGASLAAAATNAPPVAPGPGVAPAANATRPMTNAAPVAPMPPEDPFNRYGKILAPGNEPAHPIRLALPFPDVGEIKVPTQDELTMREKLEQLATLSDDDIRAKLAQWPPFLKMNLKDEAMMMARIQDFRERRSRIAMQTAHDMGLLTLTRDQQDRFEKEYWDKRLPMERDLAKQFEPQLRNRAMKMQEELFREFSSPTAPMAQGPKPPSPPPAPPKPPTPPPPAKPMTPPPAQTAQARPPMSPADPPPPGAGISQPMAQPAR